MVLVIQSEKSGVNIDPTLVLFNKIQQAAETTAINFSPTSYVANKSMSHLTGVIK